MKQYDNLIIDINSYKIKKFISLVNVMFVAWLFVGIVLVIYSNYIKTGIGIIIFTLLILVLMLTRPSKTRIFPVEKIIRIDTGVRGKPLEEYRFSDFQGFDMEVNYWVRIPINVTLYGNFKKDNKTKRYQLGASFGKKKMQQLYNEIEDIIGDNEHQG